VSTRTSRVRCPALVLRRWPYSESSLTLRLLTPELGTVPVLAKGVNKLKSGSLGVLDTWALVEVEIGGPDDREMLDLYRVTLLDRMAGISTSRERLAAAAVLGELGEEAAPPGMPAPRVFLWLQEALQRLAEDPAPRHSLLVALLGGLDLLGLTPRLDPGPGDEPVWFAPATGGALRSATRPADHARRIAPAALERMKEAQAGQKGQDAPCEEVDACLTILGDFLHYHLERPLRAWRALLEAPATHL